VTTYTLEKLSSGSAQQKLISSWSNNLLLYEPNLNVSPSLINHLSTKEVWLQHARAQLSWHLQLVWIKPLNLQTPHE